MGKIYDYVVNNTVNKNVLKDLDDTSSQSDVSVAHVEFRTLGVHTTAFFTGPFVHHDGNARVSSASVYITGDCIITMN